MRLPLSAVFVVTVLAVAACSGSGSSAPASALASGAGVDTVQVTLTDALKVDLGRSTAKARQPTTFTVTNRGATDHEFFLGDAAAQEAHAAEMASMGGMTHDEPGGIAVKPGETKSLTYTFPRAGEFLAACHTNGHYAAGMKAVITVVD